MVAALRRVLRALTLLLWVVLCVLAPASDSFGYNAVGNQTTRPAGVTLTYTPFDLPRSIKQGASAITFAYDGDEQRILGPRPKSGEGPPQAKEVGAAVPPVDVSTTGNASGDVSEPVDTAPGTT